jgi:hypothetical protein
MGGTSIGGEYGSGDGVGCQNKQQILRFAKDDKIYFNIRCAAEPKEEEPCLRGLCLWMSAMMLGVGAPVAGAQT